MVVGLIFEENVGEVLVVEASQDQTLSCDAFLDSLQMVEANGQYVIEVLCFEVKFLLHVRVDHAVLFHFLSLLAHLEFNHWFIINHSVHL